MSTGVRAAVEAVFGERYGAPSTILVRAPGRVNLIGEHTDYNDGFVLPMAIDRAVWIALRPRADRRVVVQSLDFDATAEIDLEDLRRGELGWQEYVQGVLWALDEAGHPLAGWEGVLGGDVPIGAGLSSSAALELATARACAAVAGLDWDAPAMARLAQRAENEWIGVSCGIMDQLVSAAGVAGHALCIDCRSLVLDPVPLPPDTTVAVLDTATRRGLADSAYNERRVQCEAAAKHLDVPALRDVDLAGLEERGTALDPVTRRRARHVVSENARTLEAVAAMRAGDAVRLGRLMDASHASLATDYEVSSDALDDMVACARRASGCLGARMTGAGFGGCAVALVAAAEVEIFVEQVAREYQAATGHAAQVYVCQPVEGAAVL